MSHPLALGTIQYTQILCTDTQGYEYLIKPASNQPNSGGENVNILAQIKMQNGAVDRVGINGCSIQDLLGIVIDQLKMRQESETYCDYQQICRAVEVVVCDLNNADKCEQRYGKDTHEL